MLAGILVFAMGCATMKGDREEREEEDEVQVSIDQVPVAVRTTILRESAGSTIEEIERTGEGSGAKFEAEFHKKGQEIEISVAADGTVLSREVDDEDDDDD